MTEGLGHTEVRSVESMVVMLPEHDLAEKGEEPDVPCGTQT